jgi:hypothetical protein
VQRSQLPYLAGFEPGMRELDALGWSDGLAFTAYGLNIGLRVNRPDVWEAALSSLPPGWAPATTLAVDHLYSLRVGAPNPSPELRAYGWLYLNAERIARSLELKYLCHELESSMQLHLAEWARARTFIHAGVVGWQGRALVLPGRSFSGKTTLVAALVRAGARYYSDEYAVLDEDGYVHPYTRRMALRRQEGGLPLRCRAEDLGGQPGEEPLRIGVVAFARYEPGLEWRPQVVSAGRASLEMLDHAVGALRAPRATMAAIRAAVAGTTAVKGLRGEADAAATDLLRLLAA